MEKKEIKHLVRDEEALLKNLSGNFSDFRSDAFRSWKETPAPTTRDEYWKYTRVAPLLNKTYEVDTEAGKLNNDFLRGIDAYNLVFVNGLFDENLSDRIVEKDFVVSDISHLHKSGSELLKNHFSQLGKADDYFSLLNASFFQNGPFIFIGKNKVPEKAIRIVHITRGEDRMVNVRGVVVAEAHSEARIIETWDSDEAKENLVNARVDYTIHEGAHLDVIKIQDMEAVNSLINQDFVAQQGSSTFSMSTISMSGKLIRNNMNAVLGGENSTCNLNGLYMLKGSEHVDNHTLVNHAVPHCESNELYKGILNEKSKGVFNGKVIVSRDAQKTNAFQYNGNILLTDEAQIYSKPELEIYADDVKCSHGSTTGQLDQEALFYLQSRGISKEASRNLLLKAFASEVLDKIEVPELKERIDKYISERYHTNADL